MAWIVVGVVAALVVVVVGLVCALVLCLAVLGMALDTERAIHG